MNTHKLKQLVMGFLAFGLFLPITLDGQDWSGLRGTDGLGIASTQGVLTQKSDVGFKVRWKKEIGSGYSSVVVADGRAVTMFADGKDDVLACFDANNGDELWKVPIGPTFVGKNGSFDGPLSTPLIHDGVVYSLSATGVLRAVELSDGSTIWDRDLVSEEETPLPMYGFTTSPVMAGGKLIVQLGGKNKAIAGFNPQSGKTEWATGNDMINSQTPLAVDEFGSQLVLAAGGKYLMGIHPEDGKTVFEYEHEGGNGSAMMPVPIGEHKYLLTLDDRFSKAVELRPLDEKINVSESWQQPTIKNTYNVPALCDGSVFAFSTRILTCVDPETGRAKWKSRKPGDGFLISADGHLIIVTKKGSLHLAKASAEEYTEIDQLELFDQLVWSVPAFSNDAIFIRSLGEIACVDLVEQTSIATRDSAESVPLVSEFQQLLEQVQHADKADKSKFIDKFLDGRTFPLVEDDVACFVYRGDVPDVALAGDFFGARQEQKMIRVPDTDLFYYGLHLPKDQRANYCFLVNYTPELDKRNDRKTTSSVYAGEMEFAVRLSEEPPLEMSWFSMPDWKQPAYLNNLSGPLKGKLVEQEIAAGNEEEPGISFEVYLPPSYDEHPDRRYSTVYLIGGLSAKKFGNVPQAVDQLYQQPKWVERESIIVLLNASSPAFAQVIGSQVIPHVDKNFRTKPNRDSRMLVGFGFESAMALMALASAPDQFSAASIQSPLLFAAVKEQVMPLFQAMTQPVTIRVEWGRFDMFNPHENWDLRTMSRDFAAELRKNPKCTVIAREVNDSTDWSSWQNRYHEILGLVK